MPHHGSDWQAEACPTMARMDRPGGLSYWHRRGPDCIILSKARATCSQEKWEATIAAAAWERRVRSSGVVRSSRHWAAKLAGVSARRMSWGGLTERPSAPMVVETTGIWAAMAS